MEGLIIYYVDGLITRGGRGGLISGGAYNRKYFSLHVDRLIARVCGEGGGEGV